MSFRYFTSSPALAGLVAFHYVLEAGSEGVDAGLCALLGQIQIVIGGGAEYRFGSAVAHAANGTHLIGPTDIAGWLRVPPGGILIGAGLTPAGWTCFANSRALANRLIPLPNPDALRLAATCAAADDPAVMAATFDSYLQAQLPEMSPVDARTAIIDAWVVGGNGWDVDALAAALGLSRRSLERLTARTHGSTPRRLAGKYRTLQAAGQMAVGAVTDWRDAVAAGGFADQPHFIREFKRFVGMTPEQFKARPDSLVAQLLRGNWQPGRQMGIAIWA